MTGKAGTSLTSTRIVASAVGEAAASETKARAAREGVESGLGIGDR